MVRVCHVQYVDGFDLFTILPHCSFACSPLVVCVLIIPAVFLASSYKCVHVLVAL